MKANYLERSGSHEFILEPDPAGGELRLLSAGRSHYRELEVTGRYIGGERRDLTVYNVLGASVERDVQGNITSPASPCVTPRST